MAIGCLVAAGWVGCGRTGGASDVAEPDPEFATTFAQALFDRDETSVIAFLEQHGEIADTVLPSGDRPLHVLAAAPIGEPGWKPLSAPDGASSERMLRALLQAGADPNTRGATDLTPLMVLALSGGDSKGWGKIASALIEAGASVDARDDVDATALFYAGQTGKSHLVRLLLDHGADKTLRNARGETPRDAAARAGAPDEVLNLLR